jgi:hypothetical protein
MPAEPHDSSGFIYIDRQTRSGGQSEPSEFVVSFGGSKDGVGAFSLGKATGFDALAALLRKAGVSPTDVETALQVAMAESRHQIPNVVMTKDILRGLGL